MVKVGDKILYIDRNYNSIRLALVVLTIKSIEPSFGLNGIIYYTHERNECLKRTDFITTEEVENLLKEMKIKNVN